MSTMAAHERIGSRDRWNNQPRVLKASPTRRCRNTKIRVTNRIPSAQCDVSRSTYVAACGSLTLGIRAYPTPAEMPEIRNRSQQVMCRYEKRLPTE